MFPSLLQNDMGGDPPTPELLTIFLEAKQGMRARHGIRHTCEFDPVTRRCTLCARPRATIPLTETSLFAEVNPQIVVGEDETVPVLAIRGGVIF